MFLKQHRKATLRLEGRKLSGELTNISLTNARDREVLTEYVSELRKVLRDFNPEKTKKKAAKKK